jgi:hypothetical protein
MESREKIDQLLNLLRSPSTDTINRGEKYWKISTGIKQFVDVSSPIGVWSSGSNLQKNSSHSYFWYDTFEPLSVEITLSLKSGLKSAKSVVAYMWVPPYDPWPPADLISDLLLQFIRSLNNRQIKWETVDFVGRNFFFCEISKLCFYETCLSKEKVPTKGKPRLIADCVTGASNKCFSCKSVKKNAGFANNLFWNNFYS